MKAVLAFLLLAVVVTCNAQVDGYNYVVHSLSNFQTPDGGFGNREGEQAGDLKSTADASILVSMYGLSPKIAVQLVPQFLGDLENSDGGYANKAGEASSVAATLNAVITQKNLDLPFTDAARTGAYLKGLFDEHSGLFSSGTGAGKGDIRSTGQALLALEVLGQLSSAKGLFQSVRDRLSQHLRSGDHFSFPEERNPGELTYWGVLAGMLAGFDFGSRRTWITRIEGLASPSGGFPAFEQGPVSFESTRQALHALHLLTGGNVDEALESRVHAYATAAPRLLHAVSEAHVISLLSENVEREFRIYPSLERADGSPLLAQVVQGSSFRAVVRVENPYGSAGGASVTGSTAFGSESPVTAHLSYNTERKAYVGADLFDTEDRLGPVHFKFNIVRAVAPYPSLELHAELNKLIGFGINVQSSAKRELTGKDVAESETVSVGTEFRFDVSLYRSDRKRFTSGNFEVALVVLDSSKVVLHREAISGKTASELVFSYTLSKSNLPPPRIFFDFEVSAGGGAAPHTVHEISYALASTGVVTGVRFSHPSVHIGQTQTITVQPAALTEGRAVQPFDYSESRVFFADVRSEADGPITRTIKGVTGRNAVTFDVDVPATLSSLGTHFVSFRFQAFDQSSSQLRPYDAALGEELGQLNYTVASKLTLTEVTAKHEKSEVFYGDEVSFEFKVKDRLSGRLVTRGAADDVNVFLLLKHAQSGGPEFTSASAPAAAAPDGTYTISWKITPNAVRGPGVLVLAARGLDGEEIPIYDEKGEAPVRVPVTVGGDIQVQKETHSTNNPDTSHTAIVARFSLTCNGNSLDNAELVANLRRGSTVVARDLHVASSGSTEGAYEVSWLGPHKSAPDGTYTLEVFRVTDKARVVESKGALALDPLFTVDLQHEGVAASGFPLPPEIIIIAVLGVAAAFVTYTFSQTFA